MYSNRIETLQSKCLNVIFLKIDYFCTSFTSKEKYKTYLPVFQKIYGDQILKKFHRGKKMKYKHLQILLHTYLTELNFQFFPKGALTSASVVSQLKKIGHVINSMSFQWTTCHEDIWHCFPNVYSVDLSFSTLPKMSARALFTSCSHLKDLNFSYCKYLRDLDLKHLIESKLALEKLNVSFTAVTVKGVAKVLNGIPSLRNLIFEDLPDAIDKALELQTSSCNVAESKVFNLETLHFPFLITVIVRGESRNLTKYQKACPFVNNLAVCTWHQEDLVQCSLFSNLREIFIHTPFNIDNFLKLRGDKIHTMKLKMASLSLETLLNNCPNLEILSLDRVNFTDNSNSNVISKHLSLRSLVFIGYFFNNNEEDCPFYNLITLSPALEDLKFYECTSIDYIAAAVLIQSECLKVLLFDGTSISYFLIEDIIKSCEGLELYLYTAEISQRECAKLRDMVSEMKLEVSIFWQDKNRKRRRPLAIL